MPSLRSLMTNVVPTALNVAQGLNNRSAAGSATSTLAAGADTAMGTIQAGADKAGSTLKNIYGDAQNILQPYVDSGHQTLADLQAGVAPGGGLADPFKWLPTDLENDPIFQRRLKQGMDAIAAKGNAGGTRFTGASMKDFADYATGSANDYAAQDYARQENTFRTNQKDRLNAELALQGIGTSETNKLIDAGGTYGSNLSKLQEDTAGKIAGLQTDKASAQALGQSEQGRATGEMLGNVAGTLSDQGILNKLAPAATAGANLGTLGAGVTAPAAAGIIGGSGGTAVGAGTSLAAIQAGSVPEIGSSAIGLGSIPSAPGLLGTGGATAGGTSGGLGATVTGFLTNPITIGVGAAIAGAIIWKKSQVHPTADKFVSGFQKPFGDHLGKIVNGFNQAYSTGQLSKADAQGIYDETAKLIADFEKDRAAFAAGGSKQKTVATQAEAEMVKNFGPNYQAILGKMQQEIAGLQ